MSDETDVSEPSETESSAETEEEGSIKTLEHELSAVTHAEMGGTLQPAPGLLPGEVTKHPTPFKYVMIFLILVVVTGVEIGISYTEGSVTSGVIVALLLILAVLKFAMVAAYFMHLRTDQPIFRRFFILGIITAMAVFAVAVTTLHVF
jgi:cytochrome c oxidase subunit IV